MPSILFVLAQGLSRPPPPEWPFAVLVLGGLGLLWGIYRGAYRRAERPSANRSDDSEGGSVYVLSNPAHDDLVKIGWTTRSAAARANELSSATGVPGDFAVEHEIEVAHPEAVEQAVHDRLSAHKVDKDREFFAVTPAEARRAIDRVIGPEPSLVRQSLGGVLLLLAGLGALALGTHHPADDALVQGTPALEALTSWGGGSSLPPVQNVLGQPGAWLAHVLIPNGLGYLALIPTGLVGLWGVALLRRRALRPLLPPTTLVLLGSLAAAALIGGVGQALSSDPVGWAGGGPRSGIALWAGAAGLDLAAGLRALLGPSVALALLVTAAGGCAVLLGGWIWTTGDR